MMAPVLRALVVEDDHSWQQIISEILTDCGLEVDIATQLEEATLALKSQTHRVAVIDLSLSPNDHNNIDGLRVLDAVRKLDPSCRAILLTGFATVELAVTALTDYGAFTFLRKESFHRSQFRDIINRVLLSAPHLNPSTSATSTMEISAPPAKAKTVTNRQSAERALVVEDDAGWRSILEEHLNDAGFSVRVCSSFGDALGFLRRERYTLAVIDLSLTGSIRYAWDKNKTDEPTEGYQLLASARAKGIPPIVVSGISDPQEIQRIYSEHFISAYIEKRAFDRAAFRRVVEETRMMRQFLSELNALTDREREVL